MSNQDIRRAAAGAGVKLWQIAEALGIADCSFSRKLRRELPAEEKDRIFSIIRELSQEVMLTRLWTTTRPGAGSWAKARL